MYYNCKTQLSAKRVYAILCVITKFSERLCSVQFVMCSLLTLQPHTRWLQVRTSKHIIPAEVKTSAGTVHSTVAAQVVPKSAAEAHCTVSVWPRVIVTVIRAEHHTVLVNESVPAGVTREPRHLQPVVVCLCQYSERTVLGPVPDAGVATWLQVELQLIAAGQRQLTEQFVAEPVVAAWVIETDFKLRPRTIEEVGPVVVPLDQQRDAVGYRTYINMIKV